MASHVKAYCEKRLSLTGQIFLFLHREIWKVFTTLSQLSAFHVKRYRESDKCEAVFRSIDHLPACLRVGHSLFRTNFAAVAVLWRSTCKPYGNEHQNKIITFNVVLSIGICWRFTYFSPYRLDLIASFHQLFTLMIWNLQMCRFLTVHEVITTNYFQFEKYTDSEQE